MYIYIYICIYNLQNTEDVQIYVHNWFLTELYGAGCMAYTSNKYMSILKHLKLITGWPPFLCGYSGIRWVTVCVGQLCDGCLCCSSCFKNHSDDLPTDSLFEFIHEGVYCWQGPNRSFMRSHVRPETSQMGILRKQIEAMAKSDQVSIIRFGDQPVSFRITTTWLSGSSIHVL